MDTLKEHVDQIRQRHPATISDTTAFKGTTEPISLQDLGQPLGALPEDPFVTIPVGEGAYTREQPPTGTPPDVRSGHPSALHPTDNARWEIRASACSTSLWKSKAGPCLPERLCVLVVGSLKK